MGRGEAGCLVIALGRVAVRGVLGLGARGMLIAIAAAWLDGGPAGKTTLAAEAAEVAVLPAHAEAIAAREKALADKAPQGAKLAAYLDCGAQRESAGPGPVKLKCVSGKPYDFKSEAPEALPTQGTVFFDTEQVVFEIGGLDRSRRYLAGITWWDYDDGSRTQSVIAGSPDGRLVRLGVAAIRLPDYKQSKQLPAERRFQLPVVFAQEGKLRLVVQRVDGANAVIGELWVWQLD